MEKGWSRRVRRGRKGRGNPWGRGPTEDPTFGKDPEVVTKPAQGQYLGTGETQTQEVVTPEDLVE